MLSISEFFFLLSRRLPSRMRETWKSNQPSAPSNLSDTPLRLSYLLSMMNKLNQFCFMHSFLQWGSPTFLCCRSPIRRTGTIEDNFSHLICVVICRDALSLTWNVAVVYIFAWIWLDETIDESFLCVSVLPLLLFMAVFAIVGIHKIFCSDTKKSLMHRLYWIKLVENNGNK